MTSEETASSWIWLRSLASALFMSAGSVCFAVGTRLFNSGPFFKTNCVQDFVMASASSPTCSMALAAAINSSSLSFSGSPGGDSGSFSFSACFSCTRPASSGASAVSEAGSEAAGAVLAAVAPARSIIGDGTTTRAEPPTKVVGGGTVFGTAGATLGGSPPRGLAASANLLDCSSAAATRPSNSSNSALALSSSAFCFSSISLLLSSTSFRRALIISTHFVAWANALSTSSFILAMLL
mmetsp:Transcript_143779/g.460231  ORF Transcript_143779/g.460231 Transcript_143779/m.460231 type:complete len:238 (+) Transcript_143779:1660-2373(+)